MLGRYPDISLKDARELARQNRARIQLGVDVAAEKHAERQKALEQTDVLALALAWHERHIAKTYKHPEVVLRVIRRHIDPMIGKLAIAVVRPSHIDKVLTRVIDAGTPTVANDVLRYLFGHVSPDTLNVALRTLSLDDVEHFTVPDIRRTARTHMAALRVDRFVAERALNHKVRDVEGVYNQYDYFNERKEVLERWACLLEGSKLTC